MFFIESMKTFFEKSDSLSVIALSPGFVQLRFHWVFAVPCKRNENLVFARWSFPFFVVYRVFIS
jgi:hypothetical protein